MIKLYGAPKTRSLRVAWMLEEAGLAYEYHRINLLAGEGRAPSYLEINPGGKVPALVDGDTVLTESAAICLHIASRVPDKGLVPALDSALGAECLRWCFFAIGELEQPLWTMTKHRFALPPKRRVPAVLETAVWEFQVAAKLFIEGLGARDFLVGDGFTVADVLVAHTLAWGRSAGVLEGFDGVDVLESYLERMYARQARVRAATREAA